MNFLLAALTVLRNEENFGTLGCLANLNNDLTVALSSSHVSLGKTVCIKKRRNCFGDSFLVIRNDDHEIKNDFAIVTQKFKKEICLIQITCQQRPRCH